MMVRKKFCWFFLLFVQVFGVSAQTETLNTSAQVDPATSGCFTTNVPIYCFTYNVTSGTAVFTALNGFTTTGTYVAADITKFKLYQTNFSVFNTSNLLATITTGLGPGAHSFPAFSYSMTAAVTRYFWITVDLSGVAVSGHTINCNVITAAMTTITGTENSGTNTAGGTQTISCILPVELRSFKGENKGMQNRLEWTTASETNNHFFTLERSQDGMHFETAGMVKGAGSSEEENTYVITDGVPQGAEVMYYRLLQTDEDGSTDQVTEIIAVKSSPPFVYKVFPNPATSQVHVQTLDQWVQYTVFSADGRILEQGRVGPLQNTIDVSGYQKGIYFMVLQNGEQMQTQKLVVGD